MERQNKIGARLNNTPQWRAAAGALFVTMILCLGACSPKHSSYSEFRNVPAEGWFKGEALTFVPQYGDSVGRYDIFLVVCYGHDYNYRNIGITVDLIKENRLALRVPLNVEIADSYGNWKSPGFGSQYQFKTLVRQNILPEDVSKVVMWMGMKCDLLQGINKIGIIVSPTE